LLTSDFDYQLPDELIAQNAIEPRDTSHLLVLHRSEGKIEHRTFSEIGDYLNPGDLLVANETRVIPARLRARKVPSGGKVELLLLAKRAACTWETLIKGRQVLPGQRLGIITEQGMTVLSGTVESVSESGGRVIRFDAPLEDRLAGLGTVPLPPYIHQPLANPERYQTVYARTAGSVAAPTAGLHFTPALLASLKAKGVSWATVTLHIGLDTFRPVSEPTVEEHQIHTEFCQLSQPVAEQINRTKSGGGRVIAVGTTTVRVLETAGMGTEMQAWDGPTNLFIYPGFRFRIVDALITNFHLPRSSLLMLVSAFAGQNLIRTAYAEAVRQRYRFYSLGDSMLIL
jgi:S-adenosylmethionine:tRNA ribosyltransferase-isomerase